jgi:hypothetical protein
MSRRCADLLPTFDVGSNAPVGGGVHYFLGLEVDLLFVLVIFGLEELEPVVGVRPLPVLLHSGWRNSAAET